MTKRIACTRGFTLIELLVTVVIIGVFAALAVPNFQKTWERHRFQTGNRAITSTLRKARSFAIANKQPFGVHFDTEKMTVSLFKDVENLGNLTFDAGDSIYVVDTLPREFTYLYTYFGTNVIMFQPNGSAKFDGSYGMVVTFAESKYQYAVYSVDILASTGRVKTYSQYY